MAACRRPSSSLRAAVTLRMEEAATEVTGLDLATLAIAVIGAITGVASLAWTIASHVLTGARVKVELRGGWIGPGGAVTMPMDGFDPSALPPDGFHRLVAAVQVRNVGRLPATVVNWGVNIGKTQLGQVVGPWNKPLPHRVDVEEQEAWFVDLPQVMAVVAVLAKTDLPAKQLGAAVSLGDGRTIESCKVQLD